MGEGDSVRFWFDDQVGMGLLYRLFPRVFRVVSNKESSVKECYVWVGDVVSWDISFRRALRPLELVEFESLSNLLGNVVLYRDSTDRCIWKLHLA